MVRTLLLLCCSASLVVVNGCGDYKVPDGTPTSPNASPPGSTASMGSLSAVLDNESLTAPLQTGAIWRNNAFGFSAINATGPVTRTFAISVSRASGPGTAVVGGPNFPAVSLMEYDGTTWYRWFATSRGGAGSVTITYLTSESAAGLFDAELVPDSATVAAGRTETRYLTGGTFSVSVSR